MSSSLFGIYRGIVTDLRGPSYASRIRFRAPAILGEEEFWATASVPPGATSLPEIGSQVWIAFEGGDPSFPVCIGVVLAPVDGAD